MLRQAVLEGHAWKRMALLAVASLGLVAFVGCGGGGDQICTTYPEACAPPPPTVSITPERVVVQVGGTQTFAARTTRINDPTFQWQRSADGGRTFVDIAGATGASYTLAAANLGDDATVFHVIARPRGSSGPVAEASSRLAVSPLPGVIFEDGEFTGSSWQVSELSVPPLNGAIHTEEQAADGGNPGAYRRMSHAFPAHQVSLGVLHLSTVAVYAPASDGAVLAIDYSEDCALFSAGQPGFQVYSALLLEQEGRRFRPRPLAMPCTSAVWTRMPKVAALTAADFEQFDGPACGSTQACPDFSASATPLRLGFVRFASANATPTVHGIDNWKVTVWRR